MAQAERISEIAASIRSFGRETYHRSEVLPELFSFQQELVNLTFGENAGGSLKLWDVESRLERLNESMAILLMRSSGASSAAAGQSATS